MDDMFEVGVRLVLGADADSSDLGDGDSDFQDAVDRVIARLRASGLSPDTDRQVEAEVQEVHDDLHVEYMLLTWSAESLQPVRSGQDASGEPRMIEVYVDNDVLFRSITGREKAPLEPWPTLRVTISEAGNDIIEIVASLRAPALVHGTDAPALQVLVGSHERPAAITTIAMRANIDTFTYFEGSVTLTQGPELTRQLSAPGLTVSIRAKS